MSPLATTRRRLARVALTVFDRLDRPVMRQRRGMAIVIVFSIVALLATSIVEYVYNTRVNLHLAQNHRDEVKAYFIARSGINLQQLALLYQEELESQSGFIGQAISRSNFQLWQYLDFLLPIFSSGQINAGDLGSLDLVENGATGFGEIAGMMEFHRPIPEEGKLNLNAFAGTSVDTAVLQEFCAMLLPPQYDELMGSERDQAVESRFEVIAAIIDHVDADLDRIEIDENCAIQQAGVGNEVARYDELEYEPKNEPFVTLDEVRLVPGVTDPFMDRFRDNFTVYPVAGQFYPNLADAQAFAGFLCAHIVGSSEDFSACSIPQIAQQVTYLALALEGYVDFMSNPFNALALWMGQSSLSQDQAQGFMGNGQMMPFRRDRDFTGVLQQFMTSPDSGLFFIVYSNPERRQYLGWAQQMGQQVVPPQFGIQFDEVRMRSRISTEVPQIFTITTTGRYGGASRTITAVTDVRNQGRLLYWREF